MTFGSSDKVLSAVLASLSDQDKIELLNGDGLWRTKANYDLNIPEIVMTDGAHGVRYSITQMENGGDERGSLRDFLAIVNQTAQGRGNATVGLTRPATCFPNGNLLGCSWDVDLARDLGAALAAECQHFGIHLLLGPGINIRRTPLAGRSYEYYSEDPVLTGDLAAGFIDGLQENGVGAALKHFACNNSEIERTTMSSDVEPRALREIYLAGFERAIRKSRPWTVMSSYNRINGEQASASPGLLTAILRDEWGYDGVVLSDWHGIKDRPASLLAGNDLDMPESRRRREDALAAIADGTLPRHVVDRSVVRVLRLIEKAKAGERPGSTCDFERHHLLARRAALESIVLLKNHEAALPLDTASPSEILVVGREALEPSIQGSGSATTNPTRVDGPLEEIVRHAGQNVRVRHLEGPLDADDRAGIEATVAAALEADSVIVFAGTPSDGDGEASDRRDLRLASGQDPLITRLVESGRRVVVVLTMPDAVEMPWIDGVHAVLASFFPGQGGGQAIAAILFGEANPSGKLSVTFPRKLGDVPGIHSYPGENGRHAYSEGIFVGYRSYDLREIEPLFPFGHGLSFTRFEYEDLVLDAEEVGAGRSVNVSLTVRNAGTREGREIVQLYLAPHRPGLRRPPRELKGFAKVALEPGQTCRVELRLEPRDFLHFDAASGGWCLDAEGFRVEVGASSRDIRLTRTLRCIVDSRPRRRLTTDTQPKYLLENPQAVAAVSKLLSTRLAISEDEAVRVLELTRTWFLGVHQALSWYIGDDLSVDEFQALLDRVNGDAHDAPSESAR
ncbi:beta-glucosidase family protein [Antarcticirhabdus aurantiaca]|uniref:Glycoside hydrolase family 3 C-terminal domain-containing protein n=1 Tax=Antarcticirhabdus aurantiaca TaxID=2606717 RepID=A0ACD4NNZ1_9HYPH|nr:glycoside hydrolase family 3 C-terminal domain-containing protein [Antarcticirhabdus aurantiaca]WAJ28411.1 glycoside hydrolase family 3 C-terminal domain-containing protein [Jeongeuplla avenae]